MLEHRERADAPAEPGTRPPERVHPGRDDLKQRLERLADLHPSSPDYPTVEQGRTDRQQAGRRADGPTSAAGYRADDRGRPEDASPLVAAKGRGESRNSDSDLGSRDERQGGDSPGGPPDGPQPPEHHDEPEQHRTGWDAPDVRDHPARPDATEIRLPDDRGRHIVDGDGPGTIGGGHRHGTGRPGKTEFPARWSDQMITSVVEDVSRNPDVVRWQPDGGRWVVTGERDGVRVTTVVLPDGRIWTAFPHADGVGVTRNPEAR